MKRFMSENRTLSVTSGSSEYSDILKSILRPELVDAALELLPRFSFEDK